MATWQKYDGLETRMARVGGEISEFAVHLRDHFPQVHEELGAQIMEAGAQLTDIMRVARAAAQASVIAERGHRR